MKELGTAVTSAKALHKGDQRGQTPQLQGCLHRGSPTALHGEQLPLSSVCCPLQLAGGGASQPPAALRGPGTAPPIAIQ